MNEEVSVKKVSNQSYQIRVRGYDTRFAVGKLSLEAYDYWSEQDAEVLLNADEAEQYDIPDFANIFDGEDWAELDHEHDCDGFVLNEYTLVDIFDPSGNCVKNFCLTRNALAQAEFYLTDHDVFEAQSLTHNTCAYVIEYGGYGETFVGHFKSEVPFSPTNFTFSIAKVNGKEFVDAVIYDGTPIEFRGNCGQLDAESSIDIYKG